MDVRRYPRGASRRRWRRIREAIGKCQHQRCLQFRGRKRKWNNRCDCELSDTELHCPEFRFYQDTARTRFDPANQRERKMDRREFAELERLRDLVFVKHHCCHDRCCGSCNRAIDGYNYHHRKLWGTERDTRSGRRRIEPDFDQNNAPKS